MIYVVSTQPDLASCGLYKIVSVEESMRLLAPLKVVGFDTETEGLTPTLKRLLSVQLGNRDFQVVIDCRTIDIQLYKDYLESKRLFVGWNLKKNFSFAV